eukprot:scaffold29051_cov28-Tisochrysis_lutea.AAC.3
MQQHTQDENTARYFMQFTSEVLHMMEYLTAEEDVSEAMRSFTNLLSSSQLHTVGYCHQSAHEPSRASQ